MWRWSSTVFRWAVRAVWWMWLRHVHVSTRITRLGGISEWGVIMIKTDHIRISWVSRITVLILLWHQRHRHVTYSTGVWFHVRYLAYHFCYRRYLRLESRNKIIASWKIWSILMFMKLWIMVITCWDVCCLCVRMSKGSSCIDKWDECKECVSACPLLPW